MLIRKYLMMRVLLIMIFLMASILVNGQVLFNKTYDFEGGNDIGSCVLEADSGYFSTVQIIESGKRNTAIVKLNYSGDTLWSKTYAFSDSISIQPRGGGCFINSNDSNFILVGMLDSLNNGAGAIGFITKIDYNGDTLWFKEVSYGSNPISYFYSVIANNDGTYTAAGTTGISSNADVWLVKVDGNGNVLWQQTYGGGGHDIAYSIDVGLTSGYVLGGKTRTGLPSSNAYVLKVSGTGAFEWDAVFGFDQGTDLCWVTTSETQLGYFIYGYITPDGTNDIEGMYKMLETDGSVRWEGVYGYSFWQNDWFTTAVETSDGDFVMAGSSMETDTLNNPAGWVMKIDGTNGDSLWSRRYTVRTNDHYFTDIIETSDKGLLLCGYVFPDGTGNTEDAWLLKLDSMGCEVAGGCAPTGLLPFSSELSTFKLYPNPAFDEIRVESSKVKGGEVLKAYNSIGQEIYREPLTEHQTLTINVSTWQNGVYFITQGDKRTKVVINH